MLPIFLPCASGVENMLADEVRRVLPEARVQTQRGGVSLEGGTDEVMALNLEIRLAQRVLVEVAHGPYRDENDLYQLARSVDWTQWITPEHTLRVDTTAQRSPLQSLNFATLRVKDAVCDAMRDATGERPSVNTHSPDLALMLHAGPEHASVYVDTSGEPLFKRGWREDKGDAPLKETLAAAMLMAAGWRGTPQEGGALYDPCCGSGTIVIEAAQIACGIAPGLKRRFAFERLLPFYTPEMRAAWQRLKSHAQSRITSCPVPIYASDVAFRMVDFARRNAQRAGVDGVITFQGGDALERPAPILPPHLQGTVMLNPPYGERIAVRGSAGAGTTRTMRPSAEDRSAPSDFFPRLAAHWKRAYTQHPAGWTAFVLSPDMKLPTAMRLKETQRTPMWNGPIECRLFRFDLVPGSMREPRRGAGTDSEFGASPEEESPTKPPRGSH
jgi:putative N6-adenine-specific DNA methylase